MRPRSFQVAALPSCRSQSQTSPWVGARHRTGGLTSLHFRWGDLQNTVGSQRRSRHRSDPHRCSLFVQHQRGADPLQRRVLSPTSASRFCGRGTGLEPLVGIWLYEAKFHARNWARTSVLEPRGPMPVKLLWRSRYPSSEGSGAPARTLKAAPAARRSSEEGISTPVPLVLLATGVRS
jgi:hypothetical protein